MSLAAGARLGAYEVVALLGAGGMGEVYRARDPRLGREVAVKVLPAGLSSDPERLRRFEQEARAAAALNHPNILAVYDIGQHDGAPYIVSELLDGETLRERLASGAQPMRKTVEFGVQIAHGLAAAHEKGIVHRDLKPENIFVTADGRVKILDFGLAKLTQAEPSAAAMSAMETTPPQTREGIVLGTIGYMSPEQVRGLVADHRADLFAFGTVLYEMLSGQRAFQRETGVETMTAILKEDPPGLPAAERHIPPALVRIVERCLEKAPSSRFQTATDLAFALDNAAGLSSTSTSTSTTAPAAAAGLRLLKPSWRVVLVAAFAAAVAAGVSVWVMSAGRAASEPLVTRLDVVTPPTTSPSSFALSPDGRQLAFVANGESGSQLWIRPLDQVTARPLAGTEGATYPFWSPDGRAVGFFAEAKLKRIAVAGGAPAVVADAPATRGATWSRDDLIVFAPTAGGLLQVNATGGTPMPVTRLAAGQVSHRWPQFLPDGRRFLFLVLSDATSALGIYLGSVDGGEPVRVLAGFSQAVYVAPGYLLLVSQGVLVAHRFDVARGTVTGDPIPVAQSVGLQANGLGAFSVSATGVLAHRRVAEVPRQLVWLDRTGKVTGTLGPAEDTAVSEPTLAPNGQRLAVSRWVQGNIDVWLIDIARGFPLRLTFDPGADMAPVWSPDGSRIVFMSTRNRKLDLFEKSASGAGDDQALLVNARDKSPRDWSPDGRFLLYAEQGEKTGSDLWALPLAGERTPVPVAQSRFDEAQGQFSPDGRWVAYASNETGRYEIWVQPFPATGARWQVSIEGGIYPRWRRDGKELFYVAPDNRLMAVPIQAGPRTGTLLYGAPVALFATRVVVSGTDVYSGGPFSAAQYVVAADGRFLMNVDAADTAASPINVVLNWTTGLEK